MNLRLLGPFEAWHDEKPVVLIRRQQRLLLGLLALLPESSASMDDLIDWIWDDRPPSRARAIVQTRISELRAVLDGLQPPDTAVKLSAKQGRYRLLMPSDRVDAWRFREQISAARDGRSDAEARSLIRSALSLWRGPVLGDLLSTLSAMAVAHPLETLRLAATEDLFDIELRLGNEAAIADEVMTAAVAHPHRERLVGQALQALAGAGRAAEALQWFESWRRDLREELGVDPSPALQALHVEVLRGVRAPQISAEPHVVPAPEVLPGFVVAIPHTLPLAITEFAGRTSEIEAAEAHLAAGGTGPGIVTVSGPAGIGKTALCVHIAHRVKDRYPDGEMYVNLRGADTSTSVEPFIILGRFLRALGVDGLEMPQNLDERAELYRSLLFDKSLLIVLDNAADEAQIVPLIPTGPSCGVLISSRGRLVTPFATHDIRLDTLPHGDALELLNALVGEVRAGVEPSSAAELLRCCGGLPLAVRVVAARLIAKPHWRLAKMVDLLSDERSRLDNLSYGKLDVRASVNISYHGLGSRSQELLRRLGDLDLPETNGWIAAALEATTTEAAEELLEELFDAQLLDVSGRDSAGHLRYRLHDLVRLFARERSHAEDDPAKLSGARERVFGAALHVTETLFRSLYGGDCMTMHGSARRWFVDGGGAELDRLLTWFDANRAILVSIIERAAHDRADAAAWDLVCTASPLFAMRRHYDDWRHVLEVAIDVTRESSDVLGAAAIRYRMGMLQTDLRNFPLAEQFFEQSRDAFAGIGHGRGEAVAMTYLAMLERLRRRPLGAIKIYEEALAGLTEADDHHAVAHVHRGLAQSLLDLGDFEAADGHFVRALNLYTTHGPSPIGRAQVLLWRGMLFLRQDRRGGAEKLFAEVLSVTRALGDRHGQAQALRGLAICHFHGGDAAASRAELIEALGLVRQPQTSLVESQVRKTMSDLFGEENLDR